MNCADAEKRLRLPRPLLALLAGALVPIAGCGMGGSSSGGKAEAPAKVEKLPQETEIARITLTAKAEERLGITLARVEKQQVQRRRTFGGEVMVPTGKSIIVSAPVPGTIATSGNASIPLPGQRVGVGDPVLTLVPLLSPERDVPTPAERMQMANARATLLAAQTVAEGDVERWHAEVEGARVALQRAEQLLADKAGSAKAVDEARAQLNIAQSTLAAAEERAQQLAKLAGELDAGVSDGSANPLIVTSPQSGVIRNLSVIRGQTVTAGSALFEVVNTDVMWVRVPIYVDLLPEIRTDADATIVGLDGRAAFRPRVARPVAAPASADPLNATVDLYFETQNKDAAPGPGQDETGNRDMALSPGQRVGVALMMQGQQESLVVPAKAILYDIFGGLWVYAKAGEREFERRRVLLRYTLDDRAVLEEGPSEGTTIVVDGAAELFGTEFGTGK